MAESDENPLNFYAQRINYVQQLSESDLREAPLDQFKSWFDEAKAFAQIVEPQAMVLSTVGDSGPTSRTVLCKEVNATGFTFATNYQSQKGQDIASDPRVSLLFPWHAMQRQVIVRGVASRSSAEASAAYFEQRPERSRISAIISDQSQPIESRELMQLKWDRTASEIESSGRPPQRPEYWGLYNVAVQRIEFWAGSRSRLHDRMVYCAVSAGKNADAAMPIRMDDARAWEIIRLQP